MIVKIPGAFVPMPLLERMHRNFLGVGHILENTLFQGFALKLRQAHMDISSRKYLAMCAANNLFVFFFAFIFVWVVTAQLKDPPVSPFLVALIVSMIMVLFMLFQQRSAPEIYIKKRVRNIEQNVLPALQTILIQLRSGIPLFDVLVNTAAADYGEVSREFMNVVKKINGGVPQVEALEQMALENPSNIFRSSIWQMVNGMKTGTNLSDILREIMNELAEEQLIQVEDYGAELSPLTMFYMISAVILPAIGVNFLIVLTAFMGLDVLASKALFWTVYAFIFFIQVMFLSIIKSKRPSLL